jgi:hypothetical protein
MGRLMGVFNGRTWPVMSQSISIRTTARRCLMVGFRLQGLDIGGQIAA